MVLEVGEGFWVLQDEEKYRWNINAEGQLESYTADQSTSNHKPHSKHFFSPSDFDPHFQQNGMFWGFFFFKIRKSLD